jgi:nicotinate-nucleotide adenylyltransferase
MRRVAIYGGTFDPVHNGHLEVARRVQKLFELDEVLFVPAWVPPHKRTAQITSAFHRFAMLALAIEADDRFHLSTLELDAPERPYAVDTITRLRAELGNETELFFLMGADSWLEITSWHEWRRLLSLCHFIVVTRPQYPLEAIPELPVEVVNVSGRTPRNLIKPSLQSPQTFITDAVMNDVSATAIRLAARSGDREKLRGAVPIAVARYIEKYELYRN